MIKLNELDAIIFDLGGVIINLDYDKTINAFKELGGENFDELYRQAQQNKVFDQFEVGQLTDQEFISYLLDYLPDVENEELVVNAWNAMLLDLPKERIELLETIKRSMPIFLFSNTNSIHFTEVAKRLESDFGNAQLLDQVFNKAYLSHQVGRRKPNKDAFQLVLNEQQLEPERTLFIDDSIQHIEGATALGIQTYHLTNEDLLDIFDTQETP